MIRVLVVDDQAVVRAGLRMILESESDIEVVAEAVDGVHALDLVRDHDPDVVLMDVRMPHLDGVQATRRLVDSGCSARVLILTTYDLDESVYDALRAGAAGFLLKTETPDRLVEGVRVVAAGEALLGAGITRRLVDRFVSGRRPGGKESPALSGLTDREREVLALVAVGMSNAEIADSLVVGEGTVKTHVARILSKLQLRDRVQVVVFAYEHGVIEPGGSAERIQEAIFSTSLVVESRQTLGALDRLGRDRDLGNVLTCRILDMTGSQRGANT